MLLVQNKLLFDMYMQIPFNTETDAKYLSLEIHQEILSPVQQRSLCPNYWPIVSEVFDFRSSSFHSPS